jgi:superfamily I DNA/RNA helicase
MCHTLFTDTSASGEVVTLSSIHRAKGLEADNVVILEPELLAARARDPEAFQQEKNLLYVALTRAKNHLAFASGEGGGIQIGQWLQNIAGRSMPLPKKSKFGS